MKLIKHTGWIAFVLAILTVLILVRTFNQNLFKRNASDAIELAKNNTIALDELQATNANYFIVLLDENTHEFERSISIPYHQLLEKTNRTKLEGLEENIYLYSESIETSTQSWVIMNQLGFDNIFILSKEQEPEAFKYKFQPDSSVGPEF